MPTLLTCPVCGDAPLVTLPRDQKARFCSKACRLLHENAIEHYASRFWSRVNRDTCLGAICGCQQGLDHCWPWTGSTNHGGYGWFSGHFSHPTAKHMLAHRFAFKVTNLKHFVPQKLVCHACDVPPCCRPTHLWQGMYAEHRQQMIVTHGMPPTHYRRGSQHPHSRLTEAQVLAIRALYRPGMSWTAIGRTYQITGPHVYSIIRRRIWTHLPSSE
jgi:hypothetical protein